MTGLVVLSLAFYAVKVPCESRPAARVGSSITFSKVDPVGTVDMILRVVEAFERWNLGPLLEEDRLQTVTASSPVGPAWAPLARGRPNGAVRPAKGAALG